MRAADVDFSLLPEVITEVQEHAGELEHDLHRLVTSPESQDLLSSAFRHMHTIKGDFGYCNAQPIVDFIHQLEGVMQSLRSRVFRCTPLIAEAIIQNMDQVLLMMEILASTHQFDPKPRTALGKLIGDLASAGSQEAADQAARHILLALNDEALGERGHGYVMPMPAAPESVTRALALGQALAEALEARHPKWRNRAAQQKNLILALNREYLYPVDPDVLEIAVYWHDVALLALPDSVLENPPDEKSAQWPAYANHPQLAADWLQKVAPDCQESMQIICQHHLWFNGAGIQALPYPLPPHPGALMLACADIFADRVAGLAGEDYRRAILRTVLDVSAGFETRFDSALIGAYEVVARRLIGNP